MSKILYLDKCPTEGCDGKGDNLNVFIDNSYHCFSCGLNGQNINKINKKKMENNNTNLDFNSNKYDPRNFEYLMTNGEYVALSTRNLSKEICKKYQVKYTKYLGRDALFWPRYKGSEIVSFKVKFSSDDYLNVGQKDSFDMFGSHTFDDPASRTLVITTGELDALACSQVLGEIYHCTSLDNGDSDAKKWCKHHYNKLLKYNSIVLCFDMDDSGQNGVTSFIKEFNQVGKIKVAKLPRKDANQCLIDGKGEALKWAIIKAETYKPNQIVEWDGLIDEILEKPQMGLPWPWQAMTNVDHGYYQGKTYLISSATDVGKSTFIKDISFHLAEQGIKGGLFFLEHKPKEVALKFLSSKVNQDLEQPDTQWWDKEELKRHIDTIKTTMFLFDPTLGIELRDIIDSIYYFVNINKISYVIIDNLTILSENRMIDGKKVSEMEYLNEVGKQFNKLKRELNVSFFIIAHLSQDKIQKQAYVSTSPKNVKEYGELTSEDVNKLVNKPGLTWESGRMPSIENIYGGATTAKLANEVWVLARDTTSEDDSVFRTAHVKCLKCKNQKRRSNRQFDLFYTNEGKLIGI